MSELEEPRAEVARLKELDALNRKASDGTWYVAPAGREDGLAEIEDGREYGMFPVVGEWPEIEFIVALVNIYRDGLLARASDASHYLRKTMESADEIERLKRMVGVMEDAERSIDLLQGKLLAAEAERDRIRTAAETARGALEEVPNSASVRAALSALSAVLGGEG